MFSVKAERIDENVQDQSKLRFPSNDLSIVRYLVDQVDIFQHKSRVLIVSNKTFPLKNSYKKSSKLRETQPASRLTYLGRESWSKATKSTENWRSQREEEAHSSRHFSVTAPPPLPEIRFLNKWACQQAIGNNKHFMTLPKGNSEFCFTEAKPRRTLWSKGNKTHCFARDQTLSDLLFLPTQKYNKTVKKSFTWRRLAHKFTAVSRSTI